jgi:large subunit ribosomal protein L29
MQHRNSQLSDLSKLGKTRRSIAQIKTIIKEKQS